MADLFPVAGCKIYIGGVVASQAADFIESDFSGESWTEVDGWSQMGGVGDAAQLITTALINRGRDLKQKGTRNAGSMENVFAILPTDAGQIALRAAETTINNYAFRIDLNDASGGAPSKRYFIGLVMNAREVGGDANVIQNLNATIEINSNIVRVAAT